MLLGFIRQHKAAITTRWFERILADYPVETARFLRDQLDPFANPVGAGLREEIGVILGAVIGEAEDEAVTEALDRIIRVRAVQDLSPGQAVGFVLHLKDIVREEVREAGTPSTGEDELRDFDARVDRLLLAAFAVFTACREQVYAIRVEEIRNRSIKMMERLNSWRSRREETADVNAPDLT